MKQGTVAAGKFALRTAAWPLIFAWRFA